jgi:hypothetical protein
MGCHFRFSDTLPPQQQQAAGAQYAKHADSPVLFTFN